MTIKTKKLKEALWPLWPLIDKSTYIQFVSTTSGDVQVAVASDLGKARATIGRGDPVAAKCVVNAYRLKKMLPYLPDEWGPVVLDKSLLIGPYKVMNVEADDVEFSAMLSDHVLTFDVGKIKDAIKAVSPALSALYMPNRMAITGIWIDREQGQSSSLKFVTTDTHRLHIIELDALHGDSRDLMRAVLPRPIVNVLSRLPDKQPVEVAFAKQSVMLTTEGLKVQCAAISDGFPDWRRVLPTILTRSATVEREKLIQALRAGLVVSEHAAKRTLLRMEGSVLTVMAQCPDVEETFGQVIECRPEVGETAGAKDNEFTINAQYLVDVLNACQGVEVVLRWSVATRPIQVSENALTCVIMPMALDKDAWLDKMVAR